jgi:hypothetical protein
MCVAPFIIALTFLPFLFRLEKSFELMITFTNKIPIIVIDKIIESSIEF